MDKAIIWSSSLALLALAYHFEAIAGRWRFDRLCGREGGTEFVTAQSGLRENRVWEVVGSDRSVHKVLLNSGSVALVRFRDASGALFDVRPLSAMGERYAIVPADQTKPVDYRLSVEQSVLLDDPHISQTRYTISDVLAKQLLAKHTSFVYAWGPSDRLLLSPAPSATCHEKTDLKAFIEAAVHRVQVAVKSPS